VRGNGRQETAAAMPNASLIPPPPTAVLLRAGDANNTADIVDLLILISAYNQVSTASRYNEVADFNFDGTNDQIDDLLLLIGNDNQMGN
jgi:hypothetical protein